MNLDQFTNKNTYKGILDNINKEGATAINLNGTSVPVVNKAVVPSTEDAASLLKAPNRTMNVLNYYAPSKIVLDSFSELGKDLDKSIQSSFLLQAFNIKGTDILCAAFCFMVSLMPCSARNALYYTLNDINRGTQAVASAARGINGMVETFNANIINTKDVTKNIGQIFNNPKSLIQGKSGDLAGNVSTALATPIAVLNNAKLIINALKFGMNFKFMMPNFTGKSIWDLSQNVLFALQGLALQAADEALKKLIQPVEEAINNFQPSSCYNTMADRLRQRIIETIDKLKSTILSAIADLFQHNGGFNLSFRQINIKCGWALELIAFMDALNFLSANFFMIAKGCGLTPCSFQNQPPYLPSDIGNYDVAYDNVNPFGYQPTSLPTNRITSPTTKSVDEIADKFKSFMSPDNIQIDDNSIKSTYNINNNAPQQIKDFISNGLLNNILDANYNVDLKNATVTYNYYKKCGE